MYDIVIKGGTVVDGTGNPRCKADIGIISDEIVAVSDSLDDKVDKIINADNLMVAPGFIDFHAHSDLLLLLDPYAENKIEQGITTELSGNCGQSAGPLGKQWLGDAWLESIEERFSMHSWRRAKEILKQHGINLNWRTIGKYLDQLETKGIAVNYMQLIGVETLRAAAVGDIFPKPNEGELDEMKSLLSQSLEGGAIGLSDGGLKHEFDKNELIELSKIVAEKEGIFSYHIRSYGKELESALKDAIEIAEVSKVRMVIAHLMISGKANWGKSRKALSLIDDSRARGLEIYCDLLPYTLGATNYYSPEPRSLLPDWALKNLNENKQSISKDSKLRMRILEEMKKGLSNRWHKYPNWYPLKTPLWEDMMVIMSCEDDKALEGKTIREIAETEKTDPYSALLNLILDFPSSKIAIFSGSEEDVITVMKHPTTMFGSDGGILPAIKRPGIPHPRLYGSFPRVLGKYVREMKVLTLEEAIRKMTSLPAHVLRLKDRGFIKERMKADISIFNPRTIIDKTSYIDFPDQYAEGLEYVIINGQIALDRGRHTKALAGKVLRL